MKKGLIHKKLYFYFHQFIKYESNIVNIDKATTFLELKL